MKTPRQMIDEELNIKDGYFKGAKRTITMADVVTLMLRYHKQFEFKGRPNPQDVNPYDTRAMKRTKRR